MAPAPHPTKRTRRRRLIAGAVIVAVIGAVLIALFGVGGLRNDPVDATRLSALGNADSVTTTPGRSYPAGGVRRFLFGSLNRRLWEIPVRLPVLDLDTVGGGLHALRITSGEQTIGLRFVGKDGRQYDFRSIVKNPGPVLPRWMRHGVIAALLNDQMAAQFPFGAVVVARLQEAAGIEAPVPVPVVMPNDSSLGPLRPLFAGRVGLFAVHADERAGGLPGFGNYTRIVNSDLMYLDLLTHPESSFDDRYFLRIRLIDLMVGDWDRHSGQWRWGRDGNQWRAIPEDRDWAFATIDGVAGGLARWLYPQYVGFSARFPAVKRLAIQADHIDHRVLNRLVRQDFLAVAQEVQAALSDSVIEAAVAGLPPPILVLERGYLVGALKNRRDHIVEYSAEYYQYLVRKLLVCGFATSPDVIKFDQVSDSGARVRLRSGGSSGPIRFERFVDARDTREVVLCSAERQDQVIGNHDLPFNVTIESGPY